MLHDQLRTDCEMNPEITLHDYRQLRSLVLCQTIKMYYEMSKLYVKHDHNKLLDADQRLMFVVCHFIDYIQD